MWVEITFLHPAPSGYTYHVPASLEKSIRVGTIAVAPLRKRRLTGIVTRVWQTLPGDIKGKRVKPVLCLPFDTPLFTEDLLQFYGWCARYYRASLGAILKTALPLPREILKDESFSLTAEGEKALENSHGNKTGTLSQALMKHSEIAASLVSHKDNWEVILDWTDRGWVVWHYPHFATSFAPKILFYRAPSNPPEGVRLGPKEKQLIGYVAGQGTVREIDLRRRFPRSTQTVNRLLRKKALRTFSQDEIPPHPAFPPHDEPTPVKLTHEQEVALAAFRKSRSEEAPSPLLLHGVTGGGKTELYTQCILETLQAGMSSLVLVPEIVLTPQLISRLRARCPAPIVVWHSRLSTKERWRQWLLARGSAPVVVVGARSAIFLPVKKLGLIIVDEEHDPSFKQEEGLLYNARDVAVVRGRHQRCPLILGTATPSIESFHNVKEGRFQYSVITRRPTGQPLPIAEVIDLRKEGIAGLQRAQGLMLSQPLREALLTTFSEGKQSLLFLNRRGYAWFLTCARCGETLTCPHCSVSLVLHQPKGHLRCHYCGHTRAVPQTCEVCGGPLLQMGGGTQRLEEEVRQLIPDARVARLDRDVMQKSKHYETLLSSLGRGDIDILIGTQMIVKGHDYPGITLMGVIMADHALKFPDFRASERAFQLLTQASGRCGRGSEPGRVFIQTYSPDHYSVRHATRHDFIGFYEEEIRYRRESAYPPFTRLAVIRVTGPDLEAVTSQANRLAIEGKRLLRTRDGVTSILGPAPALLSRLKNRFRWQIILKSQKSSVLHHVIERMFQTPAAKPMKGIRLHVEFDPVQLV